MHERLELPSHELIALRATIEMLKNTLLNERDASRAEGVEMEEQLKAVTAQRDRLAEALRRVMKWMDESGYYDVSPYHQAVEALQSLTTNDQVEARRDKTPPQQ
jgi:hypothetical protein